VRHPWEKSYAPGVEWGKPLTAVPIEQFLDSAAARWPRNVAIDFYDHVITFRELHDLAARAAKGFQALGVGPGVNVGLHLLNTPHYAICFFGVLMAGGRLVNFNPHAPVREIERQLSDSDTEILVTLGLPPRSQFAEGRAHLRTVVACRVEDFLPAELAESLGGGAPDLASIGTTRIEFAGLVDNDGLYRHHPRGKLDDELAVLQYTGGTTGEPKGAMLTHSNFSAVPHLIGRWMGNYLGSDSTQLVVLPLFHVFGLAVMLLSVAVGATMVVHVRFETERVLADIALKRITVLFGVPSMFSALIQDVGPTRHDFSSLKVCGSGGAPLLADVFHRFRELTGVPVLPGYSLTEITDLGAWQPIGIEPRLGTVGLPLPLTVVEVVDIETGTRVLPNGEQGEICFTGPQVMKGFWRRPAATAEAFHGGRFHSGDIGFIDQDGYVTLVGRKKELILCGGHNVYPSTIEEAICEHPAVAEVGVIGVPDADLGQMVKAFVVLKPEQAPITYRDLRRFLSDKLAAYEIPSEIVIRKNLPKTSVGKLSKKDLLTEESSSGTKTDVARADQ
jgi:long-chain acyl-CoA synthetase